MCRERADTEGTGTEIRGGEGGQDRTCWEGLTSVLLGLCPSILPCYVLKAINTQ